MVLVLGADLPHRGRGVDVVTPIRHTQTALQEKRRVMTRVVKILRHPKTEEVRGVKVGCIQGIDVGPYRRSQESGECLSILNRCNGVEGGLQRLETGRIDG